MKLSIVYIVLLYIVLLLLAIMLQSQNKTFLKFQLTWIEIRLHWAGVCFCPAVRVGGCQECSPLAGPSLARVPGPVEVSPSAAAGSETNYRTVLIWILNSRPWYLQMWEDSMRVFAIFVYTFKTSFWVYREAPLYDFSLEY